MLDQRIKKACDAMIDELDEDTLEYIINQHPFSEDGLLSNDEFAHIDLPVEYIINESIAYIHNYLKLNKRVV